LVTFRPIFTTIFPLHLVCGITGGWKYRLVLARPISGRQASTRWYKFRDNRKFHQNGEGSHCVKTFSTRKWMRATLGARARSIVARLLVTERCRSVSAPVSHRMRVDRSIMMRARPPKYFFLEPPLRPSKKRLRISTNDLYCQKLELLTYIFAADSMGLHSLVLTQLCFKFEPSEFKTASAKTEFYMK